MSQIFVSPFARATQANGTIAAGAKLYFYLSGTTTPATVYADNALSTPLGVAGVVPADASGTYPNIFLDPAIVYRVVERTATGVSLGRDADPVYGEDPSIVAITAEIEGIQTDAAALDTRLTTAEIEIDTTIEQMAEALAAGTISTLIGTRIYASRLLLNADLVPADDLYALVVGDATAANNDLYQKNGATTAGSWDGPLGIFAAASALANDYAVAAAASAASVQGLAGSIAVLNADTVNGAVQGVAVPTTGAFGSTANRAYVTTTLPGEGWLRQIQVGVRTLGSGAFEPALFSGSGASKTVKWRNGANITLAGTGLQTIPATSFATVPYCQPDWYLGFFTPTGGALIGEVSGGTHYYFAGDPGVVGTTNTFTGSGQTIQANAQVSVRGLDTEIVNRIAGDSTGARASGLQRLNIPTQSIGPTSVGGTTSQTNASSTIVILGLGPSTINTLIDYINLTVNTLGTGTFDLAVFDTVINTTRYNMASRQTVQLTKAGNQNLYGGTGFSFTPFTLKAGQLLGFVVPAGGPQFLQGTTGGSGRAVASGDPGLGVNFTTIPDSSTPQVNIKTILNLNASIMPYASGDWLAAGDSFTELFMAQWGPRFRETSGFTLSANKGINGQNLRTMADNISGADLTNVEFVSVLGGTNSWANNVPMGAIDDPKSTLSISGDVKYVADKILTLKPTVQLMFFTSPYRGSYAPGGTPTGPAEGGTNTAGQTLAQAMDMMELSAGRIGVPCLNLYRTSGWGPNTISTFTVDLLHPNTAGGINIGGQMGRFVNRMAW